MYGSVKEVLKGHELIGNKAINIIHCCEMSLHALVLIDTDFYSCHAFAPFLSLGL